MFLYETVNDMCGILTCRGYGGVVRVPEKIGNLPVTELAGVCILNSEGRNEMLSHIGDGIQMCDGEGSPASYEEKDLPPEITGDLLEDLYLPPSIRKIGNYAFYNCFGFRHLECYSSIGDLGSGLFTGCLGIRDLDIHITTGSRSCMQGIVSS